MLIQKLCKIVVLNVQVACLKISETWTRLRTYRKYKQAFYGLTLNSVGPLYGVAREKGEPHRSYERRILKVACRRGPDPIANETKKEESK